jgi:hypothetical protein
MRLTEKEIIKQLRESAEQYKPLTFTGLEEESLLANKAKADAIVEVSIENGPSFKALVEIKTVANPKALLLACRALRAEFNRINRPDLVPMVVAPYIGNRQAKILADEGISWIDLSGNMLIKVLNLYIERTGKPNKFPDTAPIKNIFQGTSSLVSRALLLKLDGFSSLDEVTGFINSLNANITSSTVSKVLKSLEQELLIDKSKSLILARDPEKLLDRLTESYVNSAERKTRKTYKFAADNVETLFRAFSNLQPPIDYAACGFYAAKLKGLATTNEVTIFVKDVEKVRKAAVPEDTTFSNITIIETNEPGVWFNVPKQSYNEVAIVDYIELYLEMMAATPRGPEIAKQLKQRILKRTDANG